MSIELNAVPSMPPRLSMQGVSKSFGDTRALDDVHIEIAPGEIHALLGQNGSGKSTLVKVLSGYWHPEPGCRIDVDGRVLRIPVAPRELRHNGIAFVHQDLGLVDSLSVFDNIRIGRFSTHRFSRAIARRKDLDGVRSALARLECSVDPGQLVGELSATDRARVAIARTLQDRRPGAGLIVFDEATRALPHDATVAVHSAIQQITAEGTSVLFVSHRLDEVILLANRVTILRDGKLAESGLPVAGMTEAKLASLMLGREFESQSFARDADANARAFVTVSGVTGKTVADASFSLARGEIVGLTGVTGSGYEELPYLLSGARPSSSGTLGVGDLRLDLTRAKLRDFLGARVVLIPERRDLYGLVASMSIVENVTLPRLLAKGSALSMGRKWQVEEAREVIAQFSVATTDWEKPVGQLSGGNQQKVLLGKWLLNDPEFLIVHEPTQGIDVGARLEILRFLSEIAGRGCAVLVVSAEPEDLSTVCNRILITENGRITRTLSDTSSAVNIVAAVYGDSPDDDGKSVVSGSLAQHHQGTE